MVREKLATPGLDLYTFPVIDALPVPVAVVLRMASTSTGNGETWFSELVGKEIPVGTKFS